MTPSCKSRVYRQTARHTQIRQ